jgi:hypothetical protein
VRPDPSASLRGAKRRSNPCLSLRRHGLPRFARNDMARAHAALTRTVMGFASLHPCYVLPLTAILKRSSTISSRASLPVPQIKKPSTRSRKSNGLSRENCRGRLCLRIHGNGDDCALPRRACDPVGPSTVAARALGVTSFRISMVSPITGAMRYRPLRDMYYTHVYTTPGNSIIN